MAITDFTTETQRSGLRYHQQVVRDYSRLPAGSTGNWTASDLYNIKDYKHVAFAGYYVEGTTAGTTGGELALEIEEVMLQDSKELPFPNDVLDRGSVPGDGSAIQTDVREEYFHTQGNNSEAVITGATHVGVTMTYTFGTAADPHAFRPGDLMCVSGASPAGYNCELAPVLGVSGNDVSIHDTATPAAYTAVTGVNTACARAWKARPVRLVLEDATRVDAIRLRMKESGNTGEPGYLYMIIKAQKA